jgi:PAS domain S-box-containing protein
MRWNTDDKRLPGTSWLAGLCIGLLLIVPLIGFLLVKLHGPQIEREAYANLEAVARLKALQIEHWLDRRRGEGQSLIASPGIAELIEDMRRGGQAGPREKLRHWLEDVRQANDYPSAQLLDPQGRILLETGEKHTLPEQTKTLLSKAFTSGEIQRSDFFTDLDDQRPSLDLAIPLQASAKGSKKPFAAVVLHIHPEHILFPLLLSWPTASQSAEALLVRRDGDSVVYLNELRHRKDTELKLTHSLADPGLPAAVALNEKKPGMTPGVDYRGVAVLAAYRPIAGTDWVLITKIDRNEALEPLWNLVLWVCLTAFAGILAISAALLALWRQQQRSFQRDTLTQREKLQRESEDRIRAVADSTSDAIVTTGVDGRIVGWNPGAERMFGYTEKEATGQPLTIFIPQRYHEKHGNGMRRLSARNTASTTAAIVEITGLRRDGSEFPIEASLTHWISGEGQFFAATIRDITDRKLVEHARQEAQDRLRKIADRLPGFVFQFRLRPDGSSCVPYASHAVHDIYRVTPDEIQNDASKVFAVVHPDDLEQHLASIHVSAENLTPWQEEYRLKFGDEPDIWLLGNALPQQEADGSVLWHGFITDITESRQQQEETRELLAENETILRNALVGIVHLKNRRIVSCNRRLEEIFQYEPGELVGQSTEILYDTHERFVAIGERGYSALSTQKTYTEEVVFRRKDGSLFWGALNGCAINPDRPQDGSIWIYADISERRQAEEESNKLLQAVEQASISIVITNREGVIEYVNPSFTRSSGYSPQEAVGQTPSVLESGQTPAATYQELWRTILAGKVWQGSLLNRCKNGTLIWEDMSISPIFSDKGEITHFVAFKIDVTERIHVQQQLIDQQIHMEDLVQQRTAELSEALEAAKAADQAKDVFLANISHELRTPLSAVIGFSGLARPLSTDPRQREYLDKIGDAGRTLADIVNDLLDLSKIAAGRMAFEARTFSLRSLLTRNSSIMSYRTEEKGLQLVEHVDDDVPDVLVGDTLRIEQILLNLLSNAVKFTEQGRIEVRVSLRAREAGCVCLNIEVEDTGIGMREEDIELLFKPFSQTDASMSRKFGGTGLGLAICKRLAELMDGNITVTSHEGSGTTFHVRIWLGLGDAADLPAAELTSAEEAAPARYLGARVLVVDDQPFNRDVVEGLLAVVGITPRMVNNGQEAIDLLGKEGPDAFDLVLMDIQMPVMDGLTATRELRARNGFSKLPIIAMTAHTMTHEKELSIAAGMNDHIGKPFDNASFYHVLAKWIPLDRQETIPAAPALSISAASAASTSPAPRKKPVEAKPAGGKMPTLPGVDTRAGLALFIGDETRYRYWLANFVDEAPAYLAQIRQSIAAGQSDQAGLAAHTLKGRSGMLGMNELYAKAAALEAALDNGAPTETLIDRLEQLVGLMCDEISKALNIRKDAAPSPDPLSEDLPAGDIPKSVLQLAAMLRAGNGDSDAALASCLEELGETAWAPRLQQALVHVRNFDFDAASKLLPIPATVQEDN